MNFVKKKSVLFILLSTLTLLSCSGGKEPLKKENDFYLSFPGYSEAVKHFFKTYKDIFRKEVDSLHKEVFYHEWVLMKKPDGWHVGEAVNRRDSLEIKKTWLLWSAESKNYAALDIEKAANPDTTAIYSRFFNPIDLHDFNVHPFFGYKEWASDVIQFFGKEEGLNDTLLYGLSRAYSVRALARIGLQTDPYTKVFSGFEKTNDLSAFSQEQINQSIEDAKKSLACLDKLLLKSPGFKTRVGTVKSKVENDRMLYWMEFTLLGKTSEAAGFIDQNSFSPTLRMFAENLLNTCEKNAILFTWEDLDTWPVLFAQNVLNIRKDVTIIPMGIAQTPLFIFYLNQKVKLNLSMDFYSSPEKNRVMLSPKETHAVPVEMADLIPQLNAGEGKLIISKTGLRKTVACAELKMNIDINSAGQRFGKNVLQRELVYTQLGYWSAADFLAMDVIYSNQWVRPVEFSLASSSILYFRAPQYLWNKGLTAEIRPVKMGVNNRFNYSTGNVDLSEIDENIFKNYNFSTLDDSEESGKIILYTYKQCFAAGASASSSLEGNEFAKKWVNQCLSIFPPEKFELHADDYWLALCAHEYGDKETETMVIRKITAFLRGYFRNPTLSQQEFEESKKILRIFLKMAQEIRDENLQNEIQTVLINNPS